MLMECRKRSWSQWATAALVLLPALYVLSFGPVFWAVSHTNMKSTYWNAFYRPVFAIWALPFFRSSPSPVGYALNELWGAYANFGMSRDRPFTDQMVDGEHYYLLP